MRDAAGFDDFAEYCECGVAHCNGSCREGEDDESDRCRDCGNFGCAEDGTCMLPASEWDWERYDKLDAIQDELDALQDEQNALNERRLQLEQDYIWALRS